MADIQEILRNYKDFLDNTTIIAESSKRRYISIIRLFIMNNGTKISKDAINTFIRDNNKDKNNNTYKAPFKYWLKSIGKKEWYDDLVGIKKKMRKKVFKYIDKSTMQDMFNLMPDKFKPLFFIQYKTGCRFQEAATIRAENIDFNIHKDLIYIRIGVNKSKTKGSKERKIRLSKKYERLIKNWCKKPYGYLFLPEKWEAFNENDILNHLDNLRRLYDRALHEVGINYSVESFSSHYLRHLFADEFLRNGGTLEALKTVMGHSRLDTTMDYVSIGDEAADNVLIKMEEKEEN